MSRYRKIDTRIWNDKKFNSLSDNGKLAFLFLLTHQHLIQLGAMRTTVAGLACELNWNTKKFKSAFDEITDQGMAWFDEESSFLGLPNFIKYNRPQSPNVIKSWDELLDYLPECELKQKIINRITEIVVVNETKSFADALPEPFRKNMPNQEQEQDQEQEQEKETALGDAEAVSKALLSFQNELLNKIGAEEYVDGAIEVLNFLNTYANKSYDPTPKHLAHIIERLKEGYDVEFCRSLIVRKTNHWKDGKESFKANINPITLFRKENFTTYKGDLVMPKDGDGNE